MHALAAGGNTSSAPGIALAIGLFIAYWIPALVAAIRHVPNTGSVIVVNLLLGWTGIGWIVALAMACRSKPPRYQVPQWQPTVISPPQGQWGQQGQWPR